MAENRDDAGLKAAIFNRLTRGEFRMAWDGIISMARKALTKREGLGPSYENRDHLQRLIHDCIYAKGGDVSARARTVELGAVYLHLSDTGRELFHDILAHDFDIDRQVLAEKIKELEKAQNQKEAITAEIALKNALTPPRISLLTQFSSLPNGLKLLIDMRATLLSRINEDQRLCKLSLDIKELLAAWFDIGMLDLQEITWNSPASLLEKLIEYEAVHEIRSWGDLRSRLDSNRLCFAFFHNKMPAEPLIFVEVALGNKLSANIQDLLNKEDDTIDPEHATTAIFYSISNTQPGLAGINLGNFLIKTVVQELSNQFDNLTHFATLSPLPGLKKWLGPRLADGNEEVLRPKEIVTLKERFACENAVLYLSEILTNDWYRDSNTSEIIKPILTRLCAQYLLAERRGNKTLDPVANFHLSNGARLERINWLADISETGMKLSYGIMVNYYYELADIEKNHEQYATKTHIVASRGVKALLK
ncbi:MAG: malonyl-CoA decarboxylase [Desulfobulbaceae bacterium]|jgi:malonyl-CoA decarboxylase|nr:malonyl-CoA decarboxylase [Desulfobulbaceae bacterium]HKJ14989.1 malonyl-CoA decarboxylase family protein [Desulfobulbales bacterium]MDH3776808.1 malonyl-CoA decarboxylase [Desulfobulbaceae bacterium]MDH3782016.1 malonyl-CoA decarboxylase [Desulfobulbaceae bacterium]MDH3921456.1 malonyl-CoA decarboxylase [Desulfobulbaceae bacterium]